MRECERYEVLVSSYSISFLGHVLYPDRPRWHWRFELRDADEPGVVFSDQVAIHMVELPKFNQAPTQLTTGCERWSYFLRHGEELDVDRLPGPLQTPAIRKAMEVLRMLTQSELEREKYEARLKYQRDEAARMRDAEERGKNRGVLIGRVQSYEEVLKLGPTPEATLLAMPLPQLQELVNRLKSEVAGRS
jgi:predicted transposase/invertase (TIGR01784 family)